MRATPNAPPAGRQGPLHDIPVGIKDVVDTADMPAGNGTVLPARRALEPLLARCDALLAPATTGEAPAGLGFTPACRWACSS